MASGEVMGFALLNPSYAFVLNLFSRALNKIPETSFRNVAASSNSSVTANAAIS